MNDAAVAWVKTLVPLVVLFVFCASGLWVYNLEIREGGYSPKTSQQASQAVLVTIQGATTHCSATVPADIHVALNEVLLLDAQHTALCHQSLARLDQLAASVQGATEMIAAASEKSYRATAYNRQ